MPGEHEELLRGLSLNDERAIGRAMGVSAPHLESSTLDAKACALARLAALFGLAPAAVSYRWAVTEAIAAGASDDEVVGVLVAVARIVGSGRTNSAALELAAALDLDLGIDPDAPSTPA